MAVCVGCGLNVNGAGILIVDLANASGLACTDADGISVVASPDACNGLEVRSNGVYSRCPDSFVCSQNMGWGGDPSVFTPGVMTAGNTYTLISECQTLTDNECACAAGCGGTAVQVCIPADQFCCQMRGFWEIVAYGGSIELENGFEGTAYLGECLDGVNSQSTPFSNQKLINYSGGTIVEEMGGHKAKNYIIFDPGDCHVFGASFNVTIAAGSGGGATWLVPPNFEIYVHLTPVGCC